LHIGEEDRHVTVASFFGSPDPHLLEISSKTYWLVKHLRNGDIRVINLLTIASCVMMAPDNQYRHLRTDGSEIDRWFMVEKPGLKLASWKGHVDDTEEDNVE
jgi:hypothetical protein